MILMVTGILCVALVRARKLLERSVIEAAAAAGAVALYILSVLPRLDAAIKKYGA